ncbi:hypothetical protein Tco_0676515 [Tanacetum coccineum]
MPEDNRGRQSHGSGTRIQVWYEDAGLSGSVQGSEKEASRRLTWRTLIGGSRNGSGGWTMEAWRTDGISALASILGKPLIMDNMTARRCQFGEERMDFARVLVEFDVVKAFKEKIEVQYRDMNNNKKGSKERSEEEIVMETKRK